MLQQMLIRKKGVVAMKGVIRAALALAVVTVGFMIAVAPAHIFA